MPNGNLTHAFAGVLAAAIAIALQSCAVIASKDHTEMVGRGSDVKTTHTTAGLAYALPKGALQIVAERKKITADDVKKAKELAESTKAKAEASAKALEVAKARLVELEGQLNLAVDPAKTKLAEDAAIAKAVVAYATVVSTSDADVAKQAQAKFDGVADQVDAWVETASIAVVPLAPDPSARFVANMAHNWTRDDAVKLVVANGLLATSTATAKDQLPGILVSIAQSLASVGVGAPPRSAWAVRNTSPADTKLSTDCKAYSRSVVFDPSDPADTFAKLQVLLSEKPRPGFDIKIGQVDTAEFTSTTSFAKPPLIEPACGRNCDGLYYRAPTAIEVRISGSSKSEADCKLIAPPGAFSAMVTVPDIGYTYVLPTRAGAFTTSKMEFAFKDGMPTDFGMDRPSEIAAIAGIPVEIAKALVSIPAELIQLRVNHDSQANALTAAQTEALKAQLEQLKAQQALDAAAAISP